MSAPLTPLLPRITVSPPFARDEFQRPWLRLLGLAVCFCASCVLYLWLGRIAPGDPNSTVSTTPFVHLWLLAYLPYALACALILCTRPAAGRWRRGELGLILGGALILRLFLLGLPPNLSHDAWRYVWDARVFLHGYSPYVTLPNAPELVPLRDFIYAYSRFRASPSIYPPGAQYIYTLSYLLAPSNLFFLKGIFVLFEMAGCLALARLLLRKGLDPARVLLYAWSPLPIVEFAQQGHLDGVALALSLLAVFSAGRTDWQGRSLTGLLVGLGTLVKIYPLLLLVPLIDLRQWRREVPLVIACALVVVVAYLPFALLGHGQVFGFFGAFASEQGQNAGLVQHYVGILSSARHLPLDEIVTWEHGVALVLMMGASLAILVARAFQRMSIEAGVLVLFSLVLAVSPHVFPWYVPMLLPWIVLLLPPRAAGARALFLARVAVLGALWLFTFTSALGYALDWPTYYTLVDGSLTFGLLAAGLLALSPFWQLFARKGWVYVKQWFGCAY